MGKNTEILVNKLIEANKKYREGSPIMSDYEFDRLEDELRSIDPNNKWFTNGVNDEKPKNREYKLKYPMMSLNKVKKIEDLNAWMDKFPNCTFVVMPKFDGLSVGMSKTMAWTRGDGMIGQLCTNHVDNICSKPYVSDDEIVRGEIIFTYDDWKKFQEYHPEAKSPRNSATGLINGDFDVTKEYDYSLLTILPYGSQNVMSDKEDELSRIGADYEYMILSRKDITEEKLNEFFFKVSTMYPMDGLVIEVNEEKYRNGTEANGNPSYSIAYKHPSFSETAISTISKIDRSINRDGVVTPIINISPSVTLSGAEISKINGINMSYVFEWGMFVGEKVKIVRSGEVIPKIIAVGDVDIPFREQFTSNAKYLKAYSYNVAKRKSELKPNFTSDLLFYCPCCGEKLYSDGVDFICKNKYCTEKKIQKVVKFFEICGLDGFGEARLRQLIDNKVIGYDIIDTFKLKYEDIVGIDGWADKSINDFIKKLEDLRNKGICKAKFLHALGTFSDLGEKTIQKIIDSLDGEDILVKDKLVSIEGIQETTADKFIKGYNEYLENKKLYDEFFEFSYDKTPINNIEGELSGKIICATGFRDKILFKKISDMGGTVLDSLTKAVNCLLVKDLSSTSSKVLKARKMGIEIMSRDEFVEKYNC